MEKGEVLVTINDGQFDYFATFEKYGLGGSVIVRLQKRIDMEEGFLSGYLYQCSKDSIITLHEFLSLAESES